MVDRYSLPDMLQFTGPLLEEKEDTVLHYNVQRSILYMKSVFGCFAFIVVRMSCYCICPVALSHSTVGGSSVCDCGIS